MRKRHTLLREPKGAEYRGLLQALAPFCQYALLVVRSSLPLSAYGQQVLKELAKEIVQQEQRHEWPGTRLLDGSATVYLIRLTEDAQKILGMRATRLYEWEQPALPEDLCLMRNESEPMLVSISHERDAYLLLSEEEKKILSSALPDLPFREE